MAIVQLFEALCGYIERLFPHEKRKQAYTEATTFAKNHPLLTSLLLVQLLFSLMPLLIFLSFVGTVAITVAGAALLFTLFWIGVAMAILAPFLMISISCALFVWVSGFAAFSIARWLHAAYFQGGGAKQTDQRGTQQADSNNNFGEIVRPFDNDVTLKRSQLEKEVAVKNPPKEENSSQEILTSTNAGDFWDPANTPEATVPASNADAYSSESDLGF